MKVYLNKIRLNQGGYDSYGRYWGISSKPLYHAESDDLSINHYCRAENRDDAKRIIRKTWRNAQFFR